MSSRFPLSRWLVLAFLIMGSQGALAGPVSIRSDADMKGRVADAAERAHSDIASRDASVHDSSRASTDHALSRVLDSKGSTSTNAIAEHVQAADQRIYQDLVDKRDSDVASFDKAHPFYAKLLSNSEFAQKLVAKWESNEKRFDALHPYLWRVVAGLSAKSPVEDARGIHLPGTGLPLGGPNQPPPGGQGPPHGLAPQVTPEPPSGILMVLGMAGLGVFVVRRHRAEISRADAHAA